MANKMQLSNVGLSRQQGHIFSDSKSQQTTLTESETGFFNTPKFQIHCKVMFK